MDLGTFRELFIGVYKDFEERGYFQENFGYDCVDGGEPGSLGANVDRYLYRHVRKENLWPVAQQYDAYTEDDLFDMIEFLFDHISKPVKGGRYHSFGSCGWHYSSHNAEFESGAAQQEFIFQMNAAGLRNRL